MSTERDPARLSDSARRAVAYLRSPQAIRDRSEHILTAGLAGKLAHFDVDLDRLDAVAERVAEVTRSAYPTLDIPYHSRWSHFAAGGGDRMAVLAPHLDRMDSRERGRCLYDLVITSVLLDAGAGTTWRYVEPGTDREFARSEGLAVASFHMFASGAFSSDAQAPYRADAEGLRQVTSPVLAGHFQVRDDNPLVGVSGRAALLQRLGDAILRHPDIFRPRGQEPPRAGHLFDHLCDRAADGAGGRTLSATVILGAVLEGLGSIWPGRISIGDVNLGDVWSHGQAGGDGLSAGLVPFHKLSQWLTYSLIEPLEAAGIQVVELDQLTGLSEYRNGGLFVDMGVLVPKHDEVTARAHGPSSEVVVEWRALTVALLDRLVEPVRRHLGKSADELPLVKVLEGGTWSAGRQVARELRADGGPPIRIDSDGTVF